MKKRSIPFLCVVFLVVLVFLFGLSIGGSKISIPTIISLLFHPKMGTEFTILYHIRLPRVLLAFAVGSSLGLSGVILQGMFRNPLVEPYTLGISGGAGVGVCLNVILQIYKKYGPITLPLFGFIGAIGVVVLIYSVSMKKRVIRLENLLLTGVMISFIASGVIMLIMSLLQIEDLHGIIFWIMGSLDTTYFSLSWVLYFLLFLCLILTYFFTPHLNAFLVGEEFAIHVGVNVERTKKLLFLISSFLTGLAVSIAGIIGFVGLVVPHIMRKIVGNDHRILLPTTTIGGGGFLILCDTIARTIILPRELPVGVVTGIVGGCIFLYFLNKKEK